MIYRNDHPHDRSWLGFVLLAILAILAALVQFAFPVEPEQIRRWQKALIWCDYNGNAVSTGFFISPDGIAVVPHHLISKQGIFAAAFPLYVTTWERDRIYKAEFLIEYPRADIFLIRVPSYRPEVWFSEFAHPEIGQKCIALGFPLGWAWFEEGRIMVHPPMELMGMNIAPSPGASGSVVLSLDGKVLAMLIKELNYAVLVPGILIKNGLAKLREEK